MTSLGSYLKKKSLDSRDIYGRIADNNSNQV